MAAFGQAGAGKSQVWKAAVWFAFQHDIARYIGTSSYMWRPAIMMHKPHSPAKSVHKPRELIDTRGW